MARPRKPDAMTPAEQVRESRARRGIVSTMDLDREMLDGLNTIRQRDGDATNVAVVRRLIRKESEK